MASSEKSSSNLEIVEDSESGTHGDSGWMSSVKEAKIQKKVFVPNYEPIQTRKRAKLSFDANPSQSPVVATPNRRKEVGQKVLRTRLTKDEVLSPDVGPRPRAVPKSLLILEPELLPRHLKKKQMRMVSNIQIHTSAVVNKSSSVSGTSASQADQPQSVSVPGNAIPLAVSSSVVIDPAEGVSSGEVKEETSVTHNGNGPDSYILTTEASDEATGDFITVSDGHSDVERVADAEGQTLSYAVISEASGCSEERSDTPTSLLLLAEAAYPSAAGPAAPSSVVSLASQSPVKTEQSLATDTAVSQAESVGLCPPLSVTTSPTFMTVSCQGGSSTIVTTSLEGQTPSPLPVASVLGGQWTCTVCGELMKETKREQHLTQHLDTVEEEDFICETCGEQLKDEEDLELHMAVEHDVEEDGIGGMEDFDEDEDENNHEGSEERMEERTSVVGNTVLTTAAGNPVYTCEQCGETFPYAAYLRRHTKAVHADAGAIYTCNMCPRSFTSESALEMHSCLHQKPGISFKCIRCSQSFSSASLLSTHAQSCLRVAIHTASIDPKRGRGRGRGQSRSRTNEHACSVCNKSFTSEVYLKAHQLSHEAGVEAGNSIQRKRGLQCLYCSEKFHHLGPLKEHMLAQHPKAFPFKCSICHRGFSRDSSRIAHQHTHQTQKLHFCSECGEGFTLQTYLNRHMKYRHLKPVKFPCSMCQKDFVRQADLIKHMRVHTGEKPYICEQCGHGFSQQSNYRYHMMRHRGEKPHVCPMCNKGFRVPSHLKMHMQQHLNERFTCQYCRKVFSQSRYLNRHLRAHAKGKQVKGREGIVPAATVSSPERMESVVVYDHLATPPIRTEQQVIVDSVGDVSEHVVVQEGGREGESVIQFVLQDKEVPNSQAEPRELAVVDGEGNTVLSTTISGVPSEAYSDTAQGSSRDSSQTEVGEEQALVNMDEGTRVVEVAFSEGEGGSMEEGNVTLPFRDLTQLLGGKHYKCDVCSHSFSIHPNSIYNMIHTDHNHILVINLNDHHHRPHADS